MKLKPFASFYIEMLKFGKQTTKKYIDEKNLVLRLDILK